MYEVISVGFGLLLLVAALFLLMMGLAMRKDKLPPNPWAGIRTKAACESKSTWYQVQRAGSLPLMGLAIAYIVSSLLFILQGVYYQTISVLIPITVLIVQSFVGIIWIYQVTLGSDPLHSANQER